MLRVALTGGIATGKSYCLGRFAAQGVPTIDADLLARDAVAPGSPGLRAVADRFGAAVITPGGGLDRPALGRIVFGDARARAALEAIIHPEVYRRIRAWFAGLPTATRLAIADIPLLFETGQEHEFDAVIVTACEPEEQLRRMIARDRLPESDARARLAAQLSSDEKIKRATHVIHTDRGFAETDAQVRDAYNALLAAA
jgi:dephospho-CoA kinase